MTPSDAANSGNHDPVPDGSVDFVTQLHEDAATLDYGDQGWVSKRLIQAADELEKLRRVKKAAEELLAETVREWCGPNVPKEDWAEALTQNNIHYASGLAEVLYGRRELSYD